MNTVKKSDAEWRAELPADKFAVLREAGHRAPLHRRALQKHGDRNYHCGACKATLFSSEAKYESGSGWPSFYDAESAENVELVTDRSHGMVRTEVRCKPCGSHLGHLFDDGPAPTGQRYCINSLALEFQPQTA